MTVLRRHLKRYVSSGKLMQLATLREGGSPMVCNVWYDAHFAPDLLRFISRRDRHHSVNIREDARVAGAIVVNHPGALGQPVIGVTFTGTARELATVGVESEVSAFAERWPAARGALEAEKMGNWSPATWIYEVAVEEWVVFDEVNYADQPRQVIRATTTSATSDHGLG